MIKASANYPSLSDYSYVAGNPVIFTDPTGMAVESTDVRQNADGTYTVVDAANDGDKGIYVVDDEGNRTGEVIGYTVQAYDFMSTKDGTGEFKFDPKVSGVTFSLDNLTVSGSVKVGGETKEVSNADAQELVEFGKKIFEEATKGNSTFYGDLKTLKELSANEAPLDFKASLGLDAYTTITAGTSKDGLPIITTLRAVGNYAFGANMRATKPFLLYSVNTYYGFVMNQVGSYNQSQNNGNGYNGGWPYFGEHTYSRSYIYGGYFNRFHQIGDNPFTPNR